MERTILAGALLIEGTGACRDRRAPGHPQGCGVALAPTPSAPHASVAGGVASGVPDLAVRKWLAVRDRGAEGFPTALGLGADPLAVAGHPAARIQAPDEVRLELARGRAVVDRT